VHNEITRRIAIALDTELMIAEADRPTANPDGLDCISEFRTAFAKEP